MKNYLNYEVEDLVQDHYFRKWTLGELPPEDQFWETWQKSHPDQYDKLERAKSLVIALRVDTIEVNPEEVKKGIERILQDSDERKTIAFYPLRSLYIAASVLLVIGCGFWAAMWYSKPIKDSQITSIVNKDSDEQETLFAAEQKREIVLKDGSRVTLGKQSQLRVSEDFGTTKREVYLIGEAFFQVVKNPDKPFLVYSGKVVTKVLGTSFRIRAYDGDANVSVGVETGKVTVFKQETDQPSESLLSEEVVLMPNQQAVFVKKDERFIKTLVDTPKEITRERLSERLDFTETPIPVVLTRLEEIYGVKLVFDADGLKDCNLTGTLKDGTLYDKLTIVCETIQATYKVMDGQVVIYGKGCK